MFRNGNEDIDFVMKSYLLPITVVSVLSFCLYASADAGRSGIAVNEKTKKCTEYWEGDECVQVFVKSGWHTHFPEYDDSSGESQIELNGETCAFTEGSEHEACICLGYGYVKDAASRKKPTVFSVDPMSTCPQ